MNFYLYLYLFNIYFFRLAERNQEGSFYLSLLERSEKFTAILALQVDDLYLIYRPNTGIQYRQISKEELNKKYRPVDCSDAQEYWEEQYETSRLTCSHAYWSGKCSIKESTGQCEVCVIKYMN